MSGTKIYDRDGWRGLIADDARNQFDNLENWLAECPHHPIVQSPGRDVFRYEASPSDYYVKYIRALTDAGLTGKDCFSWCKWVLRPSRAIHTFKISRKLLDAGFHCPEPVLAVRRRIGFYPNDIFICRDVKAKDAWQILGDFSLSHDARREIIIAIAKEVAKFHQAGFVHGDLLLRNICIGENNQVIFIDNDRTKHRLCSLPRHNLEQLGYSIMRRFNNTYYLSILWDAYSLVNHLNGRFRNWMERRILKRYNKRVKNLREQNPEHPELTICPSPSFYDLPILNIDPNLLKTDKDLLGLLPYAYLIRKATSAGNTDVYAIRVGENDFWLIKTYIRHYWLARRIIGGYATCQEFSILKYLDEAQLPVAPKPIANIRNHTLIMEFFMDSSELRGHRHYDSNTMPSQEFFLNLQKIVTAIHEKGIAHGDIRRANILITADGSPKLIDWATSNHRQLWISRLIYKLMEYSDMYSLFHVTKSYYPDLVQEQWRDIRKKMPFLVRLARGFRQQVYQGALKYIFRLTRKH